MSLPWPLIVYRGLTAALEPVVPLLLETRARRGKEERARLDERRGLAGEPRPQGPLAWLHGASVGETVSLMPLVERLIARGLTVLVTSGTVTSADVMARRLPAGALHQYVPLDVPRYMRRFLDHWRPDLAVVAESEIWPNMLIEASRRDIPMVLVNGRMSERSFDRWRRLPDVARSALSTFDLCLAQTKDDAERLARLGAPRVMATGNLKFDVPPPPADPTMLAQLEGLTSGRPVWLAASTHPGEDEQIVAAHRIIAARLPKLLTIVAPRHPRRGEDVEAIAQEAGLTATRRSAGSYPERDVGLYVADTVGEMGLFYRLAPVVFMGGSLVQHGGQNPIEPAKLGAAILHGPHVHNFTEVFAHLDRSGGAVAVADAETLARIAERWLSDTAASRKAARAAGQSVGELSGAADRIMRALDSLLMRITLAARGDG